MEILLNQLSEAYNFNKLKSYYFGTLEEIISFIPKLTFPIVLKGASGANSRNVSLASNKLDLIKNVKRAIFFI